MVAIAFAIAAPSLGLAGAGIGFSAAAAGIGIGLLAGYVDQAVVFPALFGKPEGPKPQALEGFQLSTTDPGAPRWEVFGSRAWVPCHYMWTRGIKEEITGNGQTGKGGRPFVQTLRADVGLAACDGPIARIDVMYSDERPFWSRDFDRVVLEDHRWVISAGAGGSAGRLVIAATDSDVTDFKGLFGVGNVAILDGVSPAALSGYYRVAGVAGHTGVLPSRIELTPLRGQVPAAGGAGSIFEPARLRRIDSGAASSAWIVTSVGSTHLQTQRPHHEATIPGLMDPVSGLPSVSSSDLAKIWVVGGVYRFDGFTPASINGLYKLFSRPPSNDNYLLAWEPLEGQPVGTATGAGTPTLPGIITREAYHGFLFLDNVQDYREYLGTDSQPQDPTLAAHEPDPPAHRGIAHLSLSQWNLGPHSNMFPRATARVRARSGETANAAIQRICAKVMPEGSFDVSNLRQKVLLGYSIPGGTARGPALQPLLLFHGISVQDRGGVLTFLDRRDLPVVPVATRHLNARPVGETSDVRGFLPSRVDKTDIPERVLVHYVDPTNEGANGEEGDGVRAPGSPDRGGRDTLDIDLKPLVVWPFEAKRVAREIRRLVQLETHRGPASLPPGYMDVLPAHCLTFASNNEEQELLPPGPTIASDTRLRDIVPRSVVVEVLFSTAGRARLVDNGSGALEGFPAGVTAFVNTVDYDAGRIELLCSEALDDEDAPSLTYQYERQWFMRANKATLRGHDFSLACELVTASTDEALPPVPRDLPTGLGSPLVATVPPYVVEVLDMPAIYPGSLRTVQIAFSAAPEPGIAWRGATVMQSPNGVDRWVAIGTIQAQSTMGTVVDDGPSAGASSAFIDWETELVVDLPRGETLTNATLEQVHYGQNVALCGDELIGFLEAEPDVDTKWILRGLVRGMRGTARAIDTHTGDGERFVVLFGLGWMTGLLHEPIGGFAAANRTYYWRVVPGGASVTDVATIEVLVRGNSARPAPPIFEPDDMTEDADGALQLRWWRRSIDETVLFGPSPMPTSEPELYHVIAIDHDQFSTLLGTLTEDEAILASTRRRWVVGGEGMGTPFVDRRVTYAPADMTSDLAVAGGATVGLLVYQVGAAGHSPRSDILSFTP